jgi:hypothetical protein
MMECLKRETATIGQERTDYVALPMAGKYPLIEYALMNGLDVS